LKYRIDLSYNSFSGNAPFFSSPSMTSLILSGNKFNGTFLIGEMTELQILKIDSNEFTGMKKKREKGGEREG